MHILVIVTAEVVAQKVKRTCVWRLEFDARHKAWCEIGAQVQIGNAEAVRKIQRTNQQNDALIRVESNFLGSEAEALRNEFDFARCLRGAAAPHAQQRRAAAAGQHAQQPATPGAWPHTRTSGNSVTSTRAPSARTSRQPSPLYGWFGSHANGLRLSCEPATGSGKISDFAE